MGQPCIIAIMGNTVAATQLAEIQLATTQLATTQLAATQSAAKQLPATGTRAPDDERQHTIEPYVVCCVVS